MLFGPNIHTYISNLGSFCDTPRPQTLDIYRQKTENHQKIIKTNFQKIKPCQNRGSEIFKHIKGVRAVLINKRLVVLHIGQWRFASFHSFCTIPRRREPHASALPKYIGGCTISHSVWVFKFYEKWNIIQRLLTATHHTNLKKHLFQFRVQRTRSERSM